ncbi:pentapeptide repeat-containing protein [Cognatishimia sp. WU-CL00825]|uniref:pentapeptide repeat-containing protein n=1 Tax=Cognatishimia sp. WU-CL00825 TaxID=3127658 RepID=UPI00336540B1
MADVADGLKPANENPWYVLMTLYGEEGPDLGPVNREKNREVWNAWACQNIPPEQKVTLAEQTGLELVELEGWPRLASEIHRKFKERWLKENPKSGISLTSEGLSSLLNPADNIEMSGTRFIAPLEFRKYIFPADVKMGNSVFRSVADFHKSHFTCDLSLIGTEFKKVCIFSGVRIAGKTNFENTTFYERALFHKANFEQETYFNFCSFNDDVNFSETVFLHSSFKNVNFATRTNFQKIRCKNKANFRGAQFRSETNFSAATFEGETNFSSSNFEGITNFKDATFKQGVSLSRTVFREYSYFVKSKFGTISKGISGYVDFSDSQFEKPTSFRNAFFLEYYPNFRGALLHESSVFTADKAHWPRETHQTAAQAKDSCAIIRQVLAKQGLPEDEHFFFRREMKFLRQSQSISNRPLYTLYWLLSDYGHSLRRPTIALFLLCLLPAFFYAGGKLGVSSNSLDVLLPSINDYWNATGFSFANIFKFFGFQRVYFEQHVATLTSQLKLLSAVQTVFGYALLFFLGLGLRQRFRLR